MEFASNAAGMMAIPTNTFNDTRSGRSCLNIIIIIIILSLGKRFRPLSSCVLIYSIDSFGCFFNVDTSTDFFKTLMAEHRNLKTPFGNYTHPKNTLVF